MVDNTTLDAVVSVLQKDDVQRLLFITGAGLSADSGLPTYRGIGGLYEGRLTDEARRPPGTVWSMDGRGTA